MSNFCETITITKTDSSKDICEGDYTFDAVAREYVHGTNSNCRLGKYIDFETGEYKWRAYHWVPATAPQPAGSILSAQWTMPPTIVCATSRFTDNVGDEVPEAILSDHLIQIIQNDGHMDGSPELSTLPGKPNMSQPGTGHIGSKATWETGKGVYSDFDADDGPEYKNRIDNDGALPKDRWVLNGVNADDPFRGDPAPQDPTVSRWGAKYNTRTSKYWGDGGTEGAWSRQHVWIRDTEPESPTFGEIIGQVWNDTNMSNVGHIDQMLINVYVIDPTGGIVLDQGMTSGGKTIPYREVTLNDGNFGDSQYSAWVGGVLWQFNANTQRLEIVERPSSQQNYPIFRAGGGTGDENHIAMLNAGGLKTVVSDNICFLHQNYYGSNTNYEDYAAYNNGSWSRVGSSSGRTGFEKHWLGATFSFFEGGDSLTPEYMEIKMISQDPDYVNWVSSGNQGPCASMGWYRGVGLETVSNMAEMCPTDADWSGTGIEISIPGSGGGGGGGGTTSAPTTGPTDIGAQQPGGGSGGASDPTVGPTDLDAVQGGEGSGTGGTGGSGSGSGSGSGEGPPTFTGNTLKPKYLGYVYDERSDGVSGPFVNEHLTTITTKDNSAEMFCVNEDMDVKKTDLLDFNNSVFPSFSDPFGDITQVFDTTQEKGVVCSKTGEGFLYRGQYMSAPFEEPVDGPGTVTNPLFFKDSHLAIAETNWLHLGDEHNEKQCYRVDLAFRKNSCGHLWLFVKGDDHKVKGQYKGMIKEHMKVFTNLRGRSFRIQMFVATHNEQPWALREMAIGHLYGKSF